MTTRNDIHAPSVLNPAKYSHVITFGRLFVEPAWLSMPGEREEEWDGMDEAATEYEAHGAFIHGTRGDIEDAILRCDVCGARYVYGSLFRHDDTGEVVSVGHQCADVLDLKYDLDAAARLREGSKQRRQAYLLRLRRRAALRRWAKANRDILPALRADHRTVRSIRADLIRYGWKKGAPLSWKQVELVQKLAAQAAERKVAAPIKDKRQTIEGKIVSTKCRVDSYTGNLTFKITVKIDTPDGCWLTWGTLPSNIEGAYHEHRIAQPRHDTDGNLVRQDDLDTWLRGKTIRFDAKLRAGNEDHFCFFSRPTKAQLID